MSGAPLTHEACPGEILRVAIVTLTPRLGDVELRVFLYLLAEAGGLDIPVTLSRAAIEQGTGLCHRSRLRAFSALGRRGLLAQEIQHWPDGSRRANKYQIPSVGFWGMAADLETKEEHS